MSEIVKKHNDNEVRYHNQLNEIKLGKLELKELDLFHSICYKLKESGTNEVKLNFSELTSLIGEEKNSKRTPIHIDNLNKKLASINQQIEIAPNVFERFVLFTNFTTNFNDDTLTIKTNDKFKYLLNNLVNKYTKFDLIDFVSLKSSYSKNMFKLLKQWQSTGYQKYNLADLKDLLNVPDSCRNSSTNFNKRVMLPIEEELPNYFKNLRISKIKTGTKITHIEFSWDKEKIKSNQEVINIIISQDVQEMFLYAQTNRYIKDFLTEKVKHKLIASFDEKDLIRGLKYAKDNINYQFKTFSYLENSIKKGLEKPIIKTTIVPTAVPEKTNTKLGEQLIIKTKVTQKEFDILLEKELKNVHKDILKKSPVLKETKIKELKKEFEVIEETNKDEDDKDQFPPDDFSTFEKETKKIEYPPLEECSPQMQEMAAKLKKKKEELEKLSNFSKEIILSITKLKSEISSAGFFSKKMLENELINFEQKSQEWHWLFAGLEYKTLSLDNLKYFNELTKYFEDKIGVIVSETVLDQCINHMQESPVNIKGNNLCSDTLKNLISIKDISEEKLLSKNGKKLVGGALTSRLKKLAKELGETIQLENGELISV